LKFSSLNSNPLEEVHTWPTIKPVGENMLLLLFVIKVV
jgi:hypothetical protein